MVRIASMRRHVAPLPPVLILLVDANAEQAHLYAAHLRRSAARVVIVRSADDAVALARTADVIVSCPHLAGTFRRADMVARVRADSRTRDIPIIALAAPAGERPAAGDEWSALAEACDTILPGACEPAELANAIVQLLRTHRELRRRVRVRTRARSVPRTASR
jgi:CheY-like chemotaxis protein